MNKSRERGETLWGTAHFLLGPELGDNSVEKQTNKQTYLVPILTELTVS